MTHSLEQLAKLTHSSVNGDKSIIIDSVSTLADAKSGQISFVSNPKYISQLEETTASAVILNAQLAEKYKGNALINKDPYLTFAQVLDILHAETKSKSSFHKSAIIDTSATIHPSANIGPNVVIEENVNIEADVTIDAACYIGKGTKIASGTHLYPNVTIYNNSIIGKNNIIHSGSVVGADGFGFAPTAEKEWFKILQIGNVVLGDGVELGANTTIDRAALGSTKVNNGVKLDNQVHVGHNVVIDEHTIIAAGTVIGGSTNVGKYCQIGGSTALAGHITITDNVILTGKSMVPNSIKKAGVYSSGVTSDENKKWRRNVARFKNLDDLAKKVNHLEKKLNGK